MKCAQCHGDFTAFDLGWQRLRARDYCPICAPIYAAPASTGQRERITGMTNPQPALRSRLVNFTATVLAATLFLSLAAMVAAISAYLIMHLLGL